MNVSRVTLVVIVFVFVVLAAVGAYYQFARPSERSSGKIVEVKVVAKQFSYDPPTIVVHRGDTVVLKLTSADVAHGFAIREYNIDAKIVPGETVTVQFVADKGGTFEYYCTVFCGTGHPNHRGKLIVLD